MTTEKEAELERVTRLRGFRYGLHDFLAELDLNALKEVNDHVESTYVNESLLDHKTKELLIMVACVGVGDLVSHLQIHMHAADKAGATPEEIMEMPKAEREVLSLSKTLVVSTTTGRSDLDPVTTPTNGISFTPQIAVGRHRE